MIFVEEVHVNSWKSKIEDELKERKLKTYYSLIKRGGTEDPNDLYEVVSVDGDITYSDLDSLSEIRSTKLVSQILKDYKPNIMDDYIEHSTELINRCHDGNANSLKYYLECANDRDVVLEFVKINGLDLEYASESLRGDVEIALAAINQNIDAIKYIDPNLLMDVDFASGYAQILQKQIDNGKNYVR